MLQTLLNNFLHLPSTLGGGFVGILTTILLETNNPVIGQITSLFPNVGKYVTGVAGIASALLLMFGVGPSSTSSK